MLMESKTEITQRKEAPVDAAAVVVAAVADASWEGQVGEPQGDAAASVPAQDVQVDLGNGPGAESIGG